MPGTAICVDADPVRLVQVVSNVLNNAAKYTPNAERIVVRLEVSGDEALIAVRDTGVGIAAEMIEHVFDMFVRADHSLERVQDGLGIGLTLAKRLVALHGGTLTVRSAGLGEGSEFTVKLPVANNEGTSEAPPRAE